MRIKLPMAGALLLGLTGCFLFPTPKPAAGPAGYGSPYDGLTGKSVAIVVYAPTATSDEYPGVREELSSFVATAMREHMPTTRLLDPREVITWQDRTFNWQNLSPADVGRHFGVERVLTIQVLDYSTRRILVQSELQGRLRALCKVYEILPDAPEKSPGAVLPSVWTGLIDSAWPAAKPLDPTQTNEAAVRLRTLDVFSGRLVQYFYQPRESEPSIRG